MKAKIICTTLLVENSPQALPLGAACIAAAINHHPLTKDFCKATLIDFNPEDDDFKTHSSSTHTAASWICSILMKEFEKDNTDFSKNVDFKICAFSLFVWNRVILEEAAALLKNEGIICIAGGPEITAHPLDFPVFDYVITGEGETKVPALIHEICTGEKITAEECNLETIPSPYLENILDPAKYGGALWELARGCPFKCSYCYESKGKNKVSLFPMNRIEAELDLFAKKKIPQVFVLDPTYNANKKRAIDLINLIHKKTPDTFYYFEARAEFIDRELAHAFTKIPCALQIGLQSAREEVLKAVHRPFNKKQFTKNIGLLNQEGVIFGLDLIYGLPFETFKTFCQGIDYAISLYPNNLEIFCLSVLPGTDLYDRAKELKLTFSTTPPYNVIHTNVFSQTDIQNAKGLSNACSIFYNQGRAVPWFNSVCSVLRLRPSEFFKRFAKDYDTVNNNFADITCQHKEIEKLQLDFINRIIKEKNQTKLSPLITDLIKFNGAMSRVLDTGKEEKLSLSYEAQYIDSPYATDLNFFVQNIRPKKQTVRIFKKNNFVTWC